MSAANSCNCACPTPTITEVPGSPGAAGTDGTNGADGANAYTTTTANIILPGSAGPVGGIPTFADISWGAISQIVFISDGSQWGHFKILTTPSAQSATLEWLQYNGDSGGGLTIDSGAKVSPSGTQPGGTTPISTGGTGATTATTARANLGVGGANLSVYASGTAYQLTNTDALLNFGTTDPSLTITSAGVWLILATARIDYTGATFAASRTLNLKLRRTNNTAADIANSTRQGLTDIITTLTYTFGVFALPPVIYTTTNNNDILELWGSISTVPSAGSLDASAAEIIAVKLYDQTV